MGQLFNKTSRVSQHDKVILKVKTLRDTVKIYQTKVEQSLSFEQELAVRLLQAGKREKAKCILRKRMTLEDHLRVTDGQLENLEQMITHLESSSVVRKVLEGLRAGNKALKRANEVLNIKNVETLLEETALGIQKQAEINEVIRRLTTEAPEEIVEGELNALIRTRTKQEIIEINQTINEEKKHAENQVLAEKLSEPSTSSAVKEKETKKTKKKEKEALAKPKKARSVTPKQIGIVIRDE